jgi:hypothetical protein
VVPLLGSRDRNFGEDAVEDHVGGRFLGLGFVGK